MRILGIELGSWSLKAVEMESRFRRLEILDFHEVRLPLEILDPTETYRQAVSQLLARLPVHPEKIVASLPPAQTALRFLPIPVKQRSKVEQMFRFELEDSTPFKLDETIVEHFVMPKKEGSVVFAAIAPEKHVQTHLDWMNSLGVDPDWLTFEGMGLINLYLAQVIATKKTPEYNDEPMLMLDIGHHKTNLSIFEGDSLEYFRSFPWGGAAVTETIRMSLGASLEEAERYKCHDLKMDLKTDKAVGDTKDLLLAAEQAFHPFLADVNHSLVAFRTMYKKQISKTFITGGTSKIWGVEKYLANSLGVPVEHFEPLKDQSLKEEHHEIDGARFGEPLGRALVFARKVPLLFNFRRQAAAKGDPIGEITRLFSDKHIRLGSIFGAVLLAILFVHVHAATFIAESEEDLTSKDVSKVFQDTFGASVPNQLRKSLTSDLDMLQKFINKKTGEITNKVKAVQKDRTPVVQILDGISQAFPPAVRVDVNELAIDDRTFTVSGLLYEGDLNRVTEELKGVAALDKVSLRRSGEDFTFRGEVVGR